MEKFCYFSKTQETRDFVIGLIGYLNVEEKVKAKDTHARGIEGDSIAKLESKKNIQSQ
jgi:hypothetical protein